MAEKVDLRGLICPEPVLITKKLFDNSATTAVEALVDDDVCVSNLERLSRSLKAGFSVRPQDNHFIVTIERGKQTETAGSTKPARQPAKTGGGAAAEQMTVVFIGKDTLGAGDSEADHEFSKTLLNVFLQSLFEAGHRPRAILMANTGVRLLAAEGTKKVLDDFQQAGTEVLACGLCVDYYKLKDKIAKEQITNMFAIVEYLSAAEKVISP